jgi:hypothetical protein
MTGNPTRGIPAFTFPTRAGIAGAILEDQRAGCGQASVSNSPCTPSRHRKHTESFSDPPPPSVATQTLRWQTWPSMGGWAMRLPITLPDALSQGVRRVSKALAVICLLAFAIRPGLAATAQLYGKSITVSWVEERDQREPWQQHIVMHAGKFRIYVSRAGRVFTRFEYASGGGSTRTSSDEAGGKNPHIARAINIGGNELTVTMPLKGGARHIGVSFNDNFGSCTAQVITDRPSGQQQNSCAILEWGTQI